MLVTDLLRHLLSLRVFHIATRELNRLSYYIMPACCNGESVSETGAANGTVRLSKMVVIHSTTFVLIINIQPHHSALAVENVYTGGKSIES
jgi:hypothetical protein